MSDITRDKFIPFIDTSEDKDLSALTPIDLSTVFSLNYNAQTNTRAYIKDPNDSTEVGSYQPSMEQEIRINSENPLYKWMLPYMRSMPTGNDTVHPVVIAYPDLETGEATDADCFKEATIVPGTIDSVAGTLTFTLNLNGTPEVGTVANSSGSVTFTPKAA